ncbi:hypothetical protein ACFV6F_38480 [Kitasatospora phosalacinea]|uniref:hypothetical protein n=1 Tax=Kitasatospora phosalacinea TaxID=2065 RepID=UPI0036488123
MRRPPRAPVRRRTDRGRRNGRLVESARNDPSRSPAPHVLPLTGCRAGGDGRNDNADPGGCAGFRITAPEGAAALPVALTGCATHASGDDVPGGPVTLGPGFHRVALPDSFAPAQNRNTTVQMFRVGLG